NWTAACAASERSLDLHPVHRKTAVKINQTADQGFLNMDHLAKKLPHREERHSVSVVCGPARIFMRRGARRRGIGPIWGRSGNPLRKPFSSFPSTRIRNPSTMKRVSFRRKKK